MGGSRWLSTRQEQGDIVTHPSAAAPPTTSHSYTSCSQNCSIWEWPERKRGQGAKSKKRGQGVLWHCTPPPPVHGNRHMGFGLLRTSYSRLASFKGPTNFSHCMACTVNTGALFLHCNSPTPHALASHCLSISKMANQSATYKCIEVPSVLSQQQPVNS